MPTGRVKVWRKEQGFSFIAPDAGGGDLFVHISNVVEGVEALPVGARVQFNVRPSRKKEGTLEAYDVVICG
jgi:cold shock protein